MSTIERTRAEMPSSTASRRAVWISTETDRVARVAQAIVEEKTCVIDLDLKAYFDNAQQTIDLFFGL